MLVNRLIDNRLERWAHHIREDVNIPVLLRLWSGQQYPLGEFGKPAVTLTVREATALPSLLSPTLNSLGEAYVREKIDLDGDLPELIRLGYELTESIQPNAGTPLSRALEWLTSRHTKEKDKEAIQYHYDISNEFYQLWLDREMVYSCGYFETGEEDLDTAQLKKIDHILTKIDVQPGQTLLDIGCGWGSLALRAAQKFGARCVGVTISQNQYDLARERVRAAGLEDQVEIRMQDYRDVRGQFDRITSVGMFEHVGLDNLPLYFSQVRSLLKDDGLAMNHGITSVDPKSGETPLGGGDFIERYVFPQGELPHIGLVLKTMQEAGIEALDVENLRPHYARTLSHWTERFEQQADTIRAMVGEKVYRIWRVYLAGCAHAFDIDNLAIFQVVCAKSGQMADQRRLSRRYMYC